MMKVLHPTKLVAAATLAFGVLASPLAHASKDVTFAVAIALETLDPYNTNSTLNQAAGKAYYEGLFEFDKDLKIQKLLATDYEVSADGLVYTIKLRDGIKFHDGTDFNAEAVKVNFDRVANPENRLSRYTQFNRVAKTEVVDPHTVRITLKEPFSAFINALAHPAAMMISPAALQKYGKEIGFHPVGTGPFKFVEWKPAEYLKVEKFDGYWRKGYPKVDTLTFRTVTDNNTRAAVVQTGEAQFAFPIPYEQAAVLARNDKLDVVDHKNSIMARYLSMNTRVKPFDNVKVRQAINYAINKQALAKVAFNGYATVVDGVVPQGVDFAYKIGQWPYDPAKARALLKEAGYPNGFETSLWSAYNDGTSVKAVQFLQQQLAQVGIKASVEVLESGQRVQRVQQVQKPEDAKVRMYYAGWSSSTGEADWGLRPLLSTAAFPPVMNNISYYSNPKVDDSLMKALATTDRSEKAELYKSAQETIWNDAPWAFLVTQNNVYVKSKNLSGVYVEPDTSFWFGDIDLKQ
ncbi:MULTISPECIES: glutathione ABC transporter substrate-binding protein GsiB [Bordetella]|uniref:Glutathione-binding protein GsiB n=3 Tax=Bordetella TaxID=517 RepID=A0A0C6PAC3_BORBO|nr:MULTISPECIES: glutathione ABC transporter substrate-binding protein GsiB [Bordetella]SHS27739.1 ABC transporter substrate-binding protein [Mycobacteroides abscessus subsp. abscessus]AOB27847.1 glutathione ABC transporter substrate-binding protein GsiB [Bordetella bronchiseptica]ARP75802.1 glutathione ABC transporter substrate-binding protein [Bordetella genomosp. 6]AZW23074.1 glutathione ABC transporter substrate-binding protein GsiB [Bordetella bronchiseptica]AZW45177.1 glutathione ABC tra